MRLENISQMTPLTRTLRVVVASAVALAAACATNPVTGQRQLSLISEGDEIAMGREASKEVEQTIGLVDDAELQAYVRRIGTAMASTSERPNLPWTFGVVDDPTPNAFALPGGFVYVTRGMATLMTSEAELASVLGHEIGHVTAKHSVTQVSQQQLAQLGLGVGALLLPRIRPYEALFGTGLGLLFLQHSREAERQADDLGFKYALGRGYAMAEMAKVFRSLERLPGEGGALPNFLSTHPAPGERAKTIDAKVAALSGSARGATVREAEYLREVDGLVYGDDPRQGFFREGEFVHPDLQFRFAFPRDWKGQNMKHAVVGVSGRQDAALQLTLASGSPDAAARQFASQQGISAGNLNRDTINGLQAVLTRFEANTESGPIVGIGGWVSHGGRTYQLVTYAPANAFNSQERTLQNIITSFGPLRDSAALSAQPKRLDIVTISERQTLTDFNRRLPSAVNLDELAVINELPGPSAVLAQGTLAKRVVAGTATVRR